MGTVCFRNDHLTGIIGYGYYVQVNLTICHVYYVEGLGHNLFSVGQFCDGDLEVAFRSNTCYVRNLEGDDLLTGFRASNLYTISISELAASSPVCLMSKATSTKSWLWHRRLSYLNFEAIATACFTQNQSIIHTRYSKTPYELIRGRKPNIQYFHMFGSLCYPTNDRVDLGKMKPKADIGIFIGYSESSRGFRIYNCRTKKIMETIQSKFDELTAMASECNNSEFCLNCLNFLDSSDDMNEIPSQQDLDNLFGPLYEEYYTPSTFEMTNNSVANTLDVEDTLSPSSIIVEHSEDVKELDRNTIMHSFKNPEIEEAKSSSNYQDMHNSKKKLSDVELCMYALTVSLTKPKNIKEAMLDHSWIKSMQDELNQFKLLDMWELVPLPEGGHAIRVKWLWKNKTDAKNTFIRNKSRLVIKVYSQQEGIDFEESFSPVA
ncbi:retrovirus-related pol polyprotein from transposon TNT 1-94 [Tanacetum coccineum]